MAFLAVDRGDELPLGLPVLMGSLTHDGQVDLEESLADRNRRFDVDHRQKADLRKHIDLPGIPENADSWWKEAEQGKRR